MPRPRLTVPFNVADVGDYGVAGNLNDATRMFYGIPLSAPISNCANVTTTPTPTCQFPTNQVVMNQPNDGTYNTVEVSISKRQSHNYSERGFRLHLAARFPARLSEHAERACRLRFQVDELHKVEQHRERTPGGLTSARCSGSRRARISRAS